MRKNFLILTLMTVSFCFIGCTEEQMKKADTFISDANTIATQAAPVAPVVSAPYGMILLLATNLITAGAAAWQKYRAGTLATKYGTMKTGQAQFTLENPTAAKQLYDIIGIERVSAGVK